MKRFDFPLNRILTLKKYIEEQKKEELGKIISECNKIEYQIIDNIKKSLIRINDFSIKSEELNNMLYAISIYRERLSQENAILHKHREKLEEKKNNAIDSFLAAKKETKVLENLKDRKMSEYKKQCIKEEINSIDEISIQGYIRKYRREINA
ncbi:hypothetical protein WKV44_08905 [Spirochaetia bacterium 38H-sp]|uniref:Flagellar FliJ protein n=1 Tax=Rarispira pelagica TaxID=3141764 RepID=A0ABU9UDB6_9SPIR